MKLCIPHCKQKLQVLEDCTVTIGDRYYAAGNMNLLIALGMYYMEDQEGYNQYFDSATNLQLHYRNDNLDQSFEVTIPKGTVLQITKMYIRNGGWDEDSITFKILECPDARFATIKGNLCIPLGDVNKMDVQLADEDGELE